MISIKGKINNITLDMEGNFIYTFKSKTYIKDYFDNNKDYKIEFKEWKEKRSLDSNAYLWVLLDKLAEKLNTTKEEIYKEIVHRVGVFQIIPVKPIAVDRFIERWGNKGLGWICEDIGECKNLQGYHNIIAYYGTSTYDSKEMSRILNETVEEAKKQGIETLDEIELKKMSEEYERYYTTQR